MAFTFDLLSQNRSASSTVMGKLLVNFGLFRLFVFVYRQIIDTLTDIRVYTRYSLLERTK